MKDKLDKHKNNVHSFLVIVRTHHVALALFLFLTSPVSGQEVGSFAILDLAELGQRDFLIERRALMQRLDTGKAEAGSDPAAQARLDMAELHLSQMLLPEAASFLAALETGALSPAEEQRRKTLSLAIALLSGRDGLEQAVSRSSGWVQGGALRAAAFSRLGADDTAADLLPQALNTLPELSLAMTGAILPDLLEAALASGKWDEAQALAGQFSNHAELRDAPSYRFLLAYASELTDDSLMAFDGYARAAEGRDAYAHRARIALVRLGRRTDTLSLKDAIALLDVAKWAWSGDAIAAEGWSLLADYALEEGDAPTALSALGRLLAEAATPEEAEATRQRARQAIRDFYRAGAAGEIDLGAFLEGHGRIESRWRFDSEFIESASALPQTLLDAGMTAIAAREFRALRDLASVAEELALFATDPTLVEALRLNEARALLAGGQADAAVEVLSMRPERQGSDPAVERLLIKALSRAGRSEELAGLRARALDAEASRSRAVTLYEAGKWDAAHTAFLGLWEAYPAEFAFSDATRLILAAYEVGDTVTVSRIAAAFPALTEVPGWTEIAAVLAPQAANPDALTVDVMRIGVKNADRALDAVTKATEAIRHE